MARQFTVDLYEMRLVRGNLLFADDGLYWTFRHADRAIDAFVRIDDEKVRPFHKAVHRAEAYAIGVFALDTGAGHNKGHIACIAISIRIIASGWLPPAVETAAVGRLAARQRRSVANTTSRFWTTPFRFRSSASDLLR